MSDAWPLVSLREVLTPISRPEPVDSQTTYHILGAHWYAGGLYIKDTKTGALIQADKVYRVRQGDFVYNRLFAWKGSFAVATAENDGCYVSNEFPCFTVNEQRADGQYLWHYFSQQSVWDEALGESTGGTPTSRNRLKEEKLLSMEVPLPPVCEQRRIVARVEELAAKIEEARGLRQEAKIEASTLAVVARSEAFSVLRAQDRQQWRYSQTLSEVCDLWLGATPSRSNPAFWEGTHPWVSIADLNGGYVDRTRECITDEAVAKSSVKPIEPGTLLMSFKLSIGKLGIAAVPLFTNEAIVALPVKDPALIDVS